MRTAIATSLAAAILLLDCSRTSKAPSPTDLFKLRAECANQARQFEADWRRDNGSDFEFLIFRNHYNQTLASCFVRIYYGHSDLNMDTVYDAPQGVGKPPLLMVVGGNNKTANETKIHKDTLAKIHSLMEDESLKPN